MHVMKEDAHHVLATFHPEAGRGAARPETASKNAGAGHSVGAGHCWNSRAFVGGMSWPEQCAAISG